VPDRVIAFAPGRVNLIGECTDYNDGLALPFTIDRGVTVTAEPLAGGEVIAVAEAYGEEDRFAVGDPPRGGGGWRAFVHGVAGELGAAGHRLAGARLTIGGDLPVGAGLSSSAALSVAVALGLLAAAGADAGDRLALARLCSRVENEWVGARTGLLDQLAVLFGAREQALRIDFRTLDVRDVPLALGDWRLVTVDSGERRDLAGSGYNERRAECERAAAALGVASLRDARTDELGRLPDVLARRARHVIEENERVKEAATALAAGDLERLAGLLDAAHASLRDLFEVSTPAVEATVARCRAAGAAGARLMGGGFGGQVLALMAPGASPPADAHEVRPGPGARVGQADP